MNFAEVNVQKIVKIRTDPVRVVDVVVVQVPIRVQVELVCIRAIEVIGRQSPNQKPKPKTNEAISRLDPKLIYINYII